MLKRMTLPPLLMLAAACLIGHPAKAVAAAGPDTLGVIPRPAHVAHQDGPGFILGVDTPVVATGGAAATQVAQQFADLMERTRGMHLSVTRGRSAAIPIVFAQAAGQAPEAYAISINAQRVRVTASGREGLLYGAVTLWQLCTGADSRGSHSVQLPAVQITDAPRFGWRGLMLDSARHYQSPQFILQLLDWMGLHKLNVLHWHLTDDQAWRLQIRRYPRLTQVGAWRVPAGPAAAADIDPQTGKPRLYGGFYSQETVRQIVRHAASWNITVVPEIDVPGHATAAIVAYPWLASVVPAPAVMPSDWGVYPNLYNADEATFGFLENVLSEVLALFPSKYVHIGGDEAVKDQWKASPHIQQRMRELGMADENALQNYFVKRLGRFLAARHRRLIGWDEVLDGNGLPQDATVMSWRGIDGALQAAASGRDAILTPSPTLYFDNRQGPADTQQGRARVVSVKDVYTFNPMPAELPASQRHHILGLQANVWTEHMRTEERVQYMTFPRLAAVAEVGWTAADRLDWAGFEARLPEQLARYQELGIHAADYPPVPAVTPDLLARHSSFDLRSCTEKILLGLEDDAPLSGPRATFLVDVMNPCWVLPQVPLDRVSSIQAAVGQVPFNFQIGAERNNIHLTPPQSASGELEVHLDSCDGTRVAVLSLAPAVTNNAVTVLPAAPLTRLGGVHDLCMKFTQRTLDPMWAIDWVQLAE